MVDYENTFVKYAEVDIDDMISKTINVIENKFNTCDTVEKCAKIVHEKLNIEKIGSKLDKILSKYIKS